MNYLCIMNVSYRTKNGKAIVADSLEYLASMPDESVDLVMTSPPFALQRKKEYGNECQAEYVEWLSQFGELVYKKLKPTGSFVIDIGGAYKKGIPVRSLYPFRVLIKFCDDIGFHLAEDFYWFNSSKLPSPIEWVNKRKIRAKDSINTVWWFSKTENPKSDVSKVLAPYSDRMLKLLDDPKKYFKAKDRPSGHSVGHSFKNNGGSIPSNLLQIPNSSSNSPYLALCKKVKFKSHPARFPYKLPEFFIKMLTDEGDLVVDIFGGSNTTGNVAEDLNRRWISIEMDEEYAAMSSLRFLPKNAEPIEILNLYYLILENGDVNVDEFISSESKERKFDVLSSLEKYSLYYYSKEKLSKRDKQIVKHLEFARELVEKKCSQHSSHVNPR